MEIGRGWNPWSLCSLQELVGHEFTFHPGERTTESTGWNHQPWLLLSDLVYILNPPWEQLEPRSPCRWKFTGLGEPWGRISYLVNYCPKYFMSLSQHLCDPLFCCPRPPWQAEAGRWTLQKTLTCKPEDWVLKGAKTHASKVTSYRHLIFLSLILPICILGWVVSLPYIHSLASKRYWECFIHNQEPL